MDADDLGRMLGWEFSLMVTTVRLINNSDGALRFS
jgi:hypothetical protein